MGEGQVSRGSTMPPLQGGEAQAALTSFGGSHLFMHTPFDAERPNLT